MALRPELHTVDIDIKPTLAEKIARTEEIANEWMAAANEQMRSATPNKEDIEALLAILPQVERSLMTIDPFGKEPDIVLFRKAFKEIKEAFVEELKKLITEKDIEKMTLLEIIAELREKGIDPPANKYGKLATDDRKNTLLRTFCSRSGEYKTLADPNERFEVLVAQVQYLLERMVATQDQGKNYATNPREKLKSVLNEYMLSREQILQAATYHPLWGAQVRQILKETTEAAARKSHTFSNGVRFEYGVIAGSQGQEYLKRFIAEKFPHFHEKAKDFAELLFVGFDFADIVLAQGQRVANGTRNHNTDETFDPISVQDPVAAFEQSWDRYGGNAADWRGWFLLFIEDIPDGLYGAGGNAQKTRDFQEMLFKYYSMFFPARDLIERVPAAGFCESYFPDAYDMLTLNELTGPSDNPRKEVLDLLGTAKVSGKNGRLVSAVASPLPDWDGYDITAKGWNDMLELTFKHLGNDLTDHEITISYAPNKKGLINEMLAAAGKAKVFCPKHLRMFLVPMLTLYACRLIVATAGTVKDRDHMRHKLIKEIQKSMNDERGLAGFPDEVARVVHNLEHLNMGKVNWLANPREVDEYIDDLWDLREWEKLPRALAYTKPDLLGAVDHHQILYAKCKQRLAMPEAPALRSGDMSDASKK